MPLLLSPSPPPIPLSFSTAVHAKRNAAAKGIGQHQRSRAERCRGEQTEQRPCADWVTATATQGNQGIEKEKRKCRSPVGFLSLEPRLIACLPPLACFDSSLDFQVSTQSHLLCRDRGGRMNLIGTLAPDHFSLLFSSPASFPLVSFGLDRNGAGDIETEGGAPIASYRRHELYVCSSTRHGYPTARFRSVAMLDGRGTRDCRVF